MPLNEVFDLFRREYEAATFSSAVDFDVSQFTMPH